jgi:hypothetical protein
MPSRIVRAPQAARSTAVEAARTGTPPGGCLLDEINQGYQDLDDGKLIRGVIRHEA